MTHLTLKGLFYFFIIFLLFNCKKKEREIIVVDAPNYNEVPLVKVENYVNKLFIDLIGREPLDVEMDAEVGVLQTERLSIASRVSLINKLMFNTTYREGDSSYKHAYFRVQYELAKLRTIEAASNADINGKIGIIAFDQLQDSLVGDTIGYQRNQYSIDKLQAIIDSEIGYRNNSVEIAQVYSAMVYNSIYDQINMNNFNFIEATFDDLLNRYPTQNEFNNSFDMIEYGNSNQLFNLSGQNKLDYVNILTSQEEFYEGLIWWTYSTFLSREPIAEEINHLMQTFYTDHNLHNVILYILKTDEYANFI
jgi:hypothetical protein